MKGFAQLLPAECTDKVRYNNTCSCECTDKVRSRYTIIHVVAKDSSQNNQSANEATRASCQATESNALCQSKAKENPQSVNMT